MKRELYRECHEKGLVTEWDINCLGLLYWAACGRHFDEFLGYEFFGDFCMHMYDNLERGIFHYD